MTEDEIKKLVSEFQSVKTDKNDEIARKIDNLGISQQVSIKDPGFDIVSRNDILRNTVFYRITCLTYEKKFPRQEAFENVITALRNSDCRIIYYLKGGNGHVEFYIGISSAFNNARQYHINDYEDMLVRAISGNFVGSEIEKVDNAMLDDLTDDDLVFKTVMGVPSRNNDNRDDISFQGVERLVNVMNSGRDANIAIPQNFHLLVIWDTLDLNDVREFGRQVEELYNILSIYSHSSMQTGMQDSVQKGSSEQKGTSDSSSHTLTKGSSDTDTKGVSETESTGESTTRSESISESSGTSKSTSLGTSNSTTRGDSSSESTGITHGTSEGSGLSTSNTKGTNKSHSFTNSSSSKSDCQGGGENDSHTEGSSTNKGTSDSTSKTDTTGKSSSETSGHTSNTTEGHSSNTSKTDGTSTGTSRNISKGTNSSSSHGQSESTSDGTSKSTSLSTGESHSTSASSSCSVTTEFKNKKIQDILKYIDDELMPRIKRGVSKGMFRTAVYVGAETSLNCDLLCNTLMSLAQGDKNFNTSIYSEDFCENKKGVADLQIVGGEIEEGVSAQSLLLNSRPVIDGRVDVATWLTAQEISMIAGFPQKEVPGMELREQVPFGLNISADVKKDDCLAIGHMKQEGCILSSQKVNLSRKELTKHVFIAGTTGSGKTTTCHRLLAASSGTDSSLPFLVIEPAKTEYRALLESSTPGFSDIIVFTVGNGNGVPFRFNPLEFLENENLSGHIDQLKAAFMASFDMDAAIPNLLEQGLYRVYKIMGWDVETGENEYLEDRHVAWNSNGIFFPTLSMYIDTVIDLVNEKGFDDRMRDEYIGSIRARLDSLIEGTKGVIFNTQLSVDFNDLLDRQVIIELEDIKSSEDKSFLMALIISRLSEALKSRHRTEPKFRHITLIEEAHRLLTRVMPGDSLNRKMGVELFSDLLAEIRKYGESLIIVDQIPSKLASEVLKNTNTKIIHKLFSRDDKEAVGDTMALDEHQRNYLSRLEPGEAIIFSQGWKKPVNVQVEQIDRSTDNEDVSFEVVCKNGRNYWLEHKELFSAFFKDIDEYSLSWDDFKNISRNIRGFCTDCLENCEKTSDMHKKHSLERLAKSCSDSKLKRSLIKNALSYVCFRHYLKDCANFNYEEYRNSFARVFDKLFADDEYIRILKATFISNFSGQIIMDIGKNG